MVKEFILGQMVENIKDHILMIKKVYKTCIYIIRDMVFMNGMMGEDMKVIGKMENNMGKAYM